MGRPKKYFTPAEKRAADNARLKRWRARNSFTVMEQNRRAYIRRRQKTQDPKSKKCVFAYWRYNHAVRESEPERDLSAYNYSFIPE